MDDQKWSGFKKSYGEPKSWVASYQGSRLLTDYWQNGPIDGYYHQWEIKFVIRASVMDGRGDGAAKTYTVIDFTETISPEIMEQIGSRRDYLMNFYDLGDWEGYQRCCGGNDSVLHSESTGKRQGSGIKGTHYTAPKEWIALYLGSRSKTSNKK